MKDERLEEIRRRKAAKDAEKKKKAEQEKAVKEASVPKKDKPILVAEQDNTVKEASVQKKDKHVLVAEDPPQHRQQHKRGRNSLSPASLESIPESAEEEPVKRARVEPSLALSRPTSSRTFAINNSDDFHMAMDNIISLANAAKGFVKFIGDVESRNVALELDLSEKNKLIEEGKSELARLRSVISDLEEARTASANVVKSLRASEAKLKVDLENARKAAEDVRADLENARKEAEDARAAAEQKEAEFASEKEELEEEVLAGVEDGYERCLKHIRAAVPDLDLSEFAWNSVIVDGKVTLKQNAPPV